MAAEPQPTPHLACGRCLSVAVHDLVDVVRRLPRAAACPDCGSVFGIEPTGRTRGLVTVLR